METILNKVGREFPNQKMAGSIRFIVSSWTSFGASLLVGGVAQHSVTEVVTIEIITAQILIYPCLGERSMWCQLSTTPMAEVRWPDELSRAAL